MIFAVGPTPPPIPMPPSPVTDGGWPDWAGTLPAWLAAVGALIATGIALRTFWNNAWQTKVKVARLVYCDARERKFFAKDKSAQMRTIPGLHKAWGQENVEMSNDPNSGATIRTAKRDVIYFVVKVKNNSDEPVSEARLIVED